VHLGKKIASLQPSSSYLLKHWRLRSYDKTRHEMRKALDRRIFWLTLVEDLREMGTKKIVPGRMKMLRTLCFYFLSYCYNKISQTQDTNTIKSIKTYCLELYCWHHYNVVMEWVTDFIFWNFAVFYGITFNGFSCVMSYSPPIQNFTEHFA